MKKYIELYKRKCNNLKSKFQVQILSFMIILVLYKYNCDYFLIVHFKRLGSWYFVKEMKTLSILLEYNMTLRKTILKPFLKYIQKVSNHSDYQI